MEYYKIGKIVNTQGIRGEVRVVSITDFESERFKKGNTVYAKLAKDNSMHSLTIDGVRKHKNFIILHFVDHPNINDVEFLKPSDLFVDETALANDDLEEGEYYYHDIIGLDVVTVDGEELGTIKEILAPGANDVWVVKRPGQSDLLLPKIDQVIKKVDLANHLVTVELMEGLD
ncbi:ribosome maturation factor RimM [Lentilactobacillus senioris]|uniref:Ribosome maturation factor RimM n=1 Tax=Lentilactobacillus senioris DSM 24302 = JCM 17472 TaxID=1423802 RepID=A0A0R2CQ13_9LACO|nr:ribosome maturation factor RimM [Lentilactobacillus senioris]KRM93870.1 16S rRNA processing protein RimM [Lentilactobacillus senioris DSM 24302 = JCM 17472]